MDPFAIFVFGIVLVLTLRIVAGGFDGERVESYVRQRGWTLVDCSWKPFGPGWFGEQDARIYEIVYRDEAGDTHRAHVKTSMFSGVYLTEDRIVERAAHERRDFGGEQVGPARDLESENGRLRARVLELEREREDRYR